MELPHAYSHIGVNLFYKRLSRWNGNESSYTVKKGIFLSEISLKSDCTMQMSTWTFELALIISALQRIENENVHIRFLADLNSNSNFVGDKTYKR